MSSKATVFGLGEILWDIFPAGRSLGGAPLNFARHCNQLGVAACPVSCLGPGCPLLGMIVQSQSIRCFSKNHEETAH